MDKPLFILWLFFVQPWGVHATDISAGWFNWNAFDTEAECRVVLPGWRARTQAFDAVCIPHTSRPIGKVATAS